MTTVRRKKAWGPWAGGGGWDLGGGEDEVTDLHGVGGPSKERKHVLRP